MFFVKKEEIDQSCTTGANTEAHNCCTAQPKGKAECPECHSLAKGVLGKTLAHLLKEETKSRFECLDGFYYWQGKFLHGFGNYAVANIVFMVILWPILMYFLLITFLNQRTRIKKLKKQN